MNLPPLKKKRSSLTESGNANTKSKTTLRQAGLYGALGLQIVVSFLLCFWLGLKLDEKLATAPWFLLGGVIVGMLVCGLQIYWLIANEKK